MRRPLSALLVAVALMSPAYAAKLHWPLPANSHERNGEPQHKASHIQTPKQQHRIAALPERGDHPKAEASLARVYSGTPTDVLRYHNDNYPTGWNQSETDLTPTTVASASFGQLKTLHVDSNVFAQPLMVSNYKMPDGKTHNVLIVVTGGDTVYAYDAQNYRVLWQVSMGTPQATNDVGCGDIQPEYGIASTPVIVRSGDKATIYVVAATEPASFSFHTQIHALDLGTGQDSVTPVEIDPQATLSDGSVIHFDPQNQWNRASLAYANGSIYVGIGSHCDTNAGNISGWMLRYNQKLKLTGQFNTIEAPAGYELASIWMSGYSPAIDPSGNVFAVTGNGNFSHKKNQRGFGESILSLSPNLKRVVGYFTPANYQDLNNGDTDFGSGGGMLLPVQTGQTAPPMFIATGKAGTAYLVNASKLGGIEGKKGNAALQKLNLSGCWCGPAYYNSPTGGIVYYQTDGDVLRAYSVATDASPSLTDVADGTSGAGFAGSFPVVSSNGSTASTGVVWLIRRGDTDQLEAYDAMKLGNPLFQGNAGVWSNGQRAYLSPLVANGRVYVPGYQTVTVFGLTD